MVRTTIALLIFSIASIGCADDSTPQIGSNNSSNSSNATTVDTDAGENANSQQNNNGGMAPAGDCTSDDTSGCTPPENSTVAGCVLGQCAFQCAAGFADDNGDLGDPDSDGCEADCIPSGDEVCDGIDNDCDGETDEGFDIRESCSAGTGACEVEGVLECAADQQSTRCSATAGAPSDEVCDGTDNDCDGETDEGFDLGEGCSVGVGACEREGTFICDSDGKTATCSAVPGSPRAQMCNNIDDDCDGRTDEDLTQMCGTNAGVCQAGLETCSAGAWGACIGAAGPGRETCNGLDDDCDMSVDEDFPTLGNRCTAGVGACTASGVIVCTSDGSQTECDATPGQAVTEICNNGIDDDCDGMIDENCSCNQAGCTTGQTCCYDPATMTYGCYTFPPSDQLCIQP